MAHNRSARLLVLLGVQAQAARLYLAPDGSNCAQLGPNVTNWVYMCPIGSNFVIFCPLGPPGSTWVHLGPLESSWHHWNHLGPPRFGDPSASPTYERHPISSSHLYIRACCREENSPKNFGWFFLVSFYVYNWSLILIFQFDWVFLAGNEFEKNGPC